MSVVRSEFGPTLPELLAPRLRVLPRVARLALAVLAVVVVALLGYRALFGGAGEQVVVVRGSTAFNFIHRAPLQRQAPHVGELARVGSASGSFAVRPLRLPPYRGDAAGTLPVVAAQQELALGRQRPGFQWRSDGRTSINKIPGYEIVYQYRRGAELIYGRRVMLVPTPTARDGVEIVIEAPRSTAIPNADSVGHNGALKTSLRSFRFGTERP